MTKKFGANLLVFVYFPIQHRGAAKLVLKKSSCKTIVKIYNKNKKAQMSDKVKALANFLNSNAVTKISLSADINTTPINLIDELVFVIIEQWPLFLQWRKNVTNGLIITATKNLKIENDWVGNNQSFARLNTEYTINNKELGMNSIIFNNGLAYEEHCVKYNANGLAKIILTVKLWKEMDKLNSVLAISSFLKEEKNFCFLALEPNSNKILSYAFDQFALLILNNKKYITEAFIKFKVGVALEFQAETHEQFQLKQISGMEINSKD